MAKGAAKKSKSDLKVSIIIPVNIHSSDKGFEIWVDKK